MKIINGKIAEATKEELYSYWLKRYDDILSFTEFLDKYNGIIVDENKTTDAEVIDQ